MEISCESKRMQVCCAGLGLQKGCKMLPIRNFKCLAEFLLRVGIGKRVVKRQERHEVLFQILSHNLPEKKNSKAKTRDANYLN